MNSKSELSKMAKRLRRGAKNEVSYSAASLSHADRCAQEVEAIRLEELNNSGDLSLFLAHQVAVDPHDLDSLCTVPSAQDFKGKGKQSNAEFDVNLWIYESLRFVSSSSFLGCRTGGEQANMSRFEFTLVNFITTSVYARNLSTNEGGRMALPLCCS